jgi:predicted permease
MSWLGGVRARLRLWLRRAEAEARSEEEMRLHLELEAERLMRQGCAAGEARRRAAVRFGGVERYREALRDGRRLPVLEEAARDVRYAVRSLGRTPAFAALAAVTLGIGIAAPTVVFSFTNAVLLRPLPVASPERLVRLRQVRERGEEEWVWSLAEYQAYRAESGRVFDGLAAHQASDVTVTANAGPEIALAMNVSGNYFDVLGVRPLLGAFPRGPAVERTDAPGVVVISHDYWRSRLGGDSAVVGRVLHVNGQALTIAGVAPRGFHGAMLGARPAVWLPVGLIERLQGMNPSNAGWTWLQLFGRLQPDVEREGAEAALRVVARSVALGGAYPEGQAPVATLVSRFSAVPPRIERPVFAFTLLLLAAGTLVLLTATTNVAGMLLARGSGRRREIAIRLALGAGRARVLRQLLTESMLLAACAGVIGVLATFWASGRLAAISPPFASGFELDFPIDGRVLGFAAAVSLVSSILFGLTPALHSVGRDLVPGLKDGAPGAVRRSRLRSGLVAGQIALTLMLLVAAGLFVRTVQSGLAVDHGFTPTGMVALELNLELNGYDRERGLAFFDRLLERAEAEGDIEAAALGQMIPHGTGLRTRVVVPGQDGPAGEEGVPVGFDAVSAGYFATLRMPILAGRGFRREDATAALTPLVVNRTFAERFWPGGRAVGQLVRFALDDAIVVGVVPDPERLGEPPGPYAYVPFGPRRSSNAMWLYARVRDDPAQAMRTLRTLIADLDPHVPPIALMTVEEIVGAEFFPQRLAGMFIGASGLTALLLSATGLFGLLSFHVAERTREIGVRMALGARRPAIVRMILLEAMRPLAVGLALGLLLGLGLTRLLRGFLHGLSPFDPVTFVVVPTLLAFVALLAAWLPARRATRIEALRALRAE